jgi:hypothetical protein
MSRYYRTILSTFESNPFKVGLIHAWKFEQTTGTVIPDLIGTSNIELFSSPSLGVTGKVGNATQFVSANSNWGRCQIALSFPFSYKFWINTPTGSTATFYFSANDVDSPTAFYKGLGVYQQNSRVQVRYGDGLGNAVGNRRDYRSNMILSNNTWHQVVINSTAFGTQDIYVDGILIPNSAISGSGTTVDLSSFWLYFFRQHNGGFDSGIIDEFFIYNRALSQQEITEMYNLENAGISLI